MNETPSEDSAAGGDSSRPPFAERRRWLGGIDRGLAGLNRCGLILAGSATIMMGLITLVDVLVRNFLGLQLPGSLAMVSYWCMPVLSFAALGTAHAVKSHIQVSILSERSGDRLRWVIRLLADLITIVFVVMLGVYTWENGLGAFERGQADVAHPWVIMWPPKIFSALGFFLYALTALVGIVRDSLAYQGDREEPVAVVGTEMNRGIV